MAINPGRTKVRTGTWTEDTCTVESDLIENYMKEPAVRELMEYADQRMVSTLLVSGAIGPYGVINPETKMSKVDATKKIGNNAYRYEVMGRIQKPTNIIRQVGASNADGTFTLVVEGTNLYPGMNALFHGARYQARVMTYPRAVGGNYYEINFASPSGTVFVWATHVAPQGSVKTCFGSYTSYGEKSLRGYGRDHFPDSFVNHMGIQRKTKSISGDAASTVLWYEYKNIKGEISKGWTFEQVAQAKAQFLMEDEFDKWFGVSTMKDSSGNLLSQSRLTDPETGMPIIHGDGWEEQVGGGNALLGSGVNGNATSTDFADMMGLLEKRSNKLGGLTWVAVTGVDGFANAQTQMGNLAGNQGQQFHQVVANSSEAGGAKVDAGFEFSSFNVNGNTLWFVKHPLFDDEQRFTERGADGKILMSSNYFISNLGTKDRKNLEILSKGAYGLDRSMIFEKINGMTGGPGAVLSEEDAMKFAMLKQDMLMVYDVTTCGIIYKQ